MSKSNKQTIEIVNEQPTEQNVPVTEQPTTEVHPVLLITPQVVQPVGDNEPSFSTKSAAIRYYNSIGMTNGQIAKKMNIRFQHVRNVLITPVSKPTK